MEVKQFYSRSISPLVTKTFACKWSDDNRLAIITEKGIHLFELKPAPTQASPILNLSRTFINTLEAVPSEFYAKDVVDDIFNWKKEDVYSFLMQEAYTPKFPKATTPKPEIIDAVWSPQNLLHPQKCLLAIVNSVGALELALEVDRSWISIYEFSTKWLQAMQEDYNTSNEILNCDILRNRINRLLITTVCWSNIYKESVKNFAYLITAHRNSEIAIWKIYEIQNDLNINVPENINVELKFKKKLEAMDVKINSLLWIHLDEKNFLLVIGFFNGQISVLKIHEFEGKITSSFYSECHSNEDSIPVDSLYILQQTKDWHEIIAVKGMFLIIFRVDLDGKIINTNFIPSPGFSITGVTAINYNMILITTQDGNLHMIDKFRDQEELMFSPVKHDITRNSVQYLSLACSSNKLLFAVITSPSVIYDHLIDRDPTSICFCTIHNEPTLNPMDILYNNKSESLLNHWECLELIKINALKYNNLQEILPSIIENLESVSPYKLRIVYWILTINETVRRRNFSHETLKPSEEINQLKHYLFLHSAISYLHCLALLENLSDLQKLSMSLLKNHLEIWLAGEEEEAETDLSRNVKQVLEVINKFVSTEQEKCDFCGSIITEPWASSCTTGHKLPRCAITCLQVTCTRFRSCPICHEIFHPCLDLVRNEVRCLYCDVPVLYKDELVDSLLKSKRNLSKRPAIVVNNKDKKEDVDNNDISKNVSNA